MKRSIYVVLTSIEDNLVFNNFEEEPRNPKILEKRELTLQELSDDESIRLFLSTYNRSILEEKCYPETVYSKSVKEKVKNLPNFIKCENLPGKIIDLAEIEYKHNSQSPSKR